MDMRLYALLSKKLNEYGGNSISWNGLTIEFHTYATIPSVRQKDVIYLIVSDMTLDEWRYKYGYLVPEAPALADTDGSLLLTDDYNFISMK